MKKEEFLQQLWTHLKDISPAEKTRLLEYYNELYFDRLESGESEEDIVAGFGTPLDAAEKFLNEAYFDAAKADTEAEADVFKPLPLKPDSDNKEAKSEKETDKKDGKKRINTSFLKNKTFWTIYLAGFVITFPLTAAAFGIIMGLIGAAIGIVCGLFGLGIGLCSGIVAGIYGFASSIVVMLENVPAGLAQMGISFVALSLGLLGIFVFKKVIVLISSFIRRRRNNGKQ